MLAWDAQKGPNLRTRGDGEGAPSCLNPHFLLHAFSCQGEGSIPKTHAANTPRCSRVWRPGPPSMERYAGPAFSLRQVITTGRRIETPGGGGGGKKAVGAGGTENGYNSDGNVAYQTRIAQTHHGSRVRTMVGLPQSRWFYLFLWCKAVLGCTPQCMVHG